MLTIRLFGSCEVRSGKGTARRFPTHAAKVLFVYLVLHRSRFHPRERLIGLFWGDHPETKARKLLRMELWRLRRTLERAYIVLRGHELAFNTSAKYWLDVEEFERGIAAAQRTATAQLPLAQVELLQRAVALYRGDLIEGIYDDWCSFPRDHYKRLLRCALERLMRHHEERRDWPAAIEYSQRLLQQDPLLEHVHRRLMSYRYASGDRCGAIRQYDTCVRLLRQELNVGPMPETEALCDGIKAGRIEGPPARLDRGLANLLEVEEGLEAAQSLLTWGIQELRRLKSPSGPNRAPVTPR